MPKQGRVRELLETVDDLKARGIHLLSLEERLDTSSAAGELVFHVFGAIAQKRSGDVETEGLRALRTLTRITLPSGKPAKL